MGVGDGVGVALSVGFGAGIATPLFQANFPFSLTAVYFLPLHTIVWPRRVGLSEGPLAACDTVGFRLAKIAPTNVRNDLRLIEGMRQIVGE